MLLLTQSDKMIKFLERKTSDKHKDKNQLYMYTLTSGWFSEQYTASIDGFIKVSVIFFLFPDTCVMFYLSLFV